jgi:hypothetical protein
MNRDSCVLVLSGKLRKLSITFVFRRFTEKIVLVVISLIDPNLFYNQDFLSSLYFRSNISCFLYPNMTSHILKLRRKERSTILLL